MELTKVKYAYGRDDIFDYYILDEKRNAIEQDIDKNSLAFKIGGEGKIKVSKYGNIIFGGFDYLLEKRKKGTDLMTGYSLATEDEIERI